MSKKLQVLLFAALIIVALILAFKPKIKKQNTTEVVPQNNVQNTQAKPEGIVAVDTEKLPEMFPADFPIEKDVVVISNFNLNKDNKYQSTRSFETSQTLAQKYKLYNDYLQQNGWKITQSVNDKLIKSIFASKDNSMVLITMSQNTATLKNEVYINFVYSN